MEIILYNTARLKDEFTSDELVKEFYRFCRVNNIPASSYIKKENFFKGPFQFVDKYSTAYQITALDLREENLYGIRTDTANFRFSENGLESLRNDNTEQDSIHLCLDLIFNGAEHMITSILSSDSVYLKNAIYKSDRPDGYLSILSDDDWLQEEKGLPYSQSLMIDMKNIHTVEDAICSNLTGIVSPIVFISKYLNYDYMIDPDYVQKQLRGYAHIILEGNSDNTNYLKMLMTKRNKIMPYDGYIGIYQNGVPEKKFNPYQNDGRYAAAKMLCGTVLRTNVTAEKIGITWDILTDVYKKAEIKRAEKLKKEAEIKNSELYIAVSTELKTKTAVIQDLETENKELKTKVQELNEENSRIKLQAMTIANKAKTLTDSRKAKAQVTNQYNASDSQLDSISALEKKISTLQKESFEKDKKYEALKNQLDEKKQVERCLLIYGSEKEKYNSEIKDIILESLAEYKEQSCAKGSRRYDIISDILTANEYSGKQKARRNEIKELIGHVNLDEKICEKAGSAMKKYGITTETGGKHGKVQFNEDNRYIITISQTPSDTRANKNTASEICKILF